METKSVKKGETFTVSVPSNVTTGYSWEPKTVDDSKVRLVKSEYQRPSGNLMGAPGHHEFTFEAVGNGESQIELIYKRPWENTIGKTHNVQVQIS
eukprot:CAMPEP_0168578628 /NCGR_PEP_ID=MMETSP0413-20121227/21435_1 /TAXON_ID=136452 /ORGANISM="Filamoeba nolandi, Strain NC-AS-23-1" /LENGTH=94 /DNA_ID=CAMNT_0008612489 /DNA_START=32 /DNA_END=312 /DNA_ORIENTATION=+